MWKVCLGLNGFMSVEKLYEKHFSLSQILDHARQLNYQGMELIAFHKPYPEELEGWKEIKRNFSEYRSEIPAMQGGGPGHPASSNEDERNRYIQGLKNQIHFAAEIGIKVITTYSTYAGDIPESGSLQRLIDTYSQCVKVAEEAGVILSTEPEPVLLLDSLEKTLKVLQAINSDYFGITYDFAHANVLSGGNPVSFLKPLSGRIKHVHVTDNDGTLLEKNGIVHSSRHLPLGEGRLNCFEILKTLKEIEYDGWLQIDLWQYPDIFDGSEKSKKILDEILSRLFK